MSVSPLLARHWRTCPGGDLAEALDWARASVEAFSEATRQSGSLIQSWVRGRPMMALDHYPPHDAVDYRSGSQFYYHSHRHGRREHGHLHLFFHATASGRRRSFRGSQPTWSRSAPSHLFAISLDPRGLPVALFTVNRWVTEGYWFNSETTLDFVDRFSVHVRGHRASSAWLRAFVQFYRPLIKALLIARDRRLARHGSLARALDDRRLEVLSSSRLDWAADLDAVESEARGRSIALAASRFVLKSRAGTRTTNRVA